MHAQMIDSYILYFALKERTKEQTNERTNERTSKHRTTEYITDSTVSVLLEEAHTEAEAIARRKRAKSWNKLVLVFILNLFLQQYNVFF